MNAFGTTTEGDVIEAQGSEDQEGRAARVPKGPATPTNEEIEAHNATHIPPRSWCPACVAGCKMEPRHMRTDEEGREIPTVGIDYCFLKKKVGRDEPAAKVLTVKDSKSKAIFAIVVMYKGTVEIASAARAAELIQRLGYDRIILKDDQEPAITALAEQIKSQLPGQVIIEKSVKLDSQSNGSVENAVRYLEDTMRTMLIGLEARIGWNFPMNRPVIAWLVMHAADTRTRH